MLVKRVGRFVDRHRQHGDLEHSHLVEHTSDAVVESPVWHPDPGESHDVYGCRYKVSSREVLDRRSAD